MKLFLFFIALSGVNAFEPVVFSSPRPLTIRVSEIKCQYARNFRLYNELDPIDNEIEEDDRSNKFDIIAKVGEFMGYPVEYKWKGFRIAVYSLVLGALVGEAMHDFQHPGEEFLREFMNSP